jgi:hypothetical protein
MTQQIRTVLSREPEKMTPRTMAKSSLFPFRPLLLSVLWMLAGCIQVCLGQTKSLETEIVPASLAVSPAGTATQFVFILRNPGDAEVRQLQVSWIVDEGISLDSAEPIEIATLGPHTAVSYVLKVSQARLSSIDRSLLLRIAYKDSSGPKILAQAISVKSRESDSIDKVVDAKVQTTLDSLDSSHSGTIDLFLTNKQGQSITLDVTANGPEFTCFDPPKEGCPAVPRSATPTLAKIERKTIPIGPYQTHIEEFRVGARQRVEPGKYLLSFEIVLEGTGVQPAGSTVLSQTVDVGVVAESAILKALSVPSFLLLPGCLVMLTLGFFSKYGWSWSKPAKSDPIPEPTDAYFWLASITISGVMALVYRWIWDRWYFVSYGIEDIALVWIYSVLLGLLLYSIFFGWPRFVEFQSTPTAEDDPVRVLKRLAWQGHNNIIERRTIGADPNKKTVFIISKASEDGRSVWVSAGINVYVAKARKDLQDKIRNELEASGSPRKLAEFLNPAKQSGTGATDKKKELAVWDPASVPNPGLVEVANLGPSDQFTIAVEKN